MNLAIVDPNFLGNVSHLICELNVNKDNTIKGIDFCYIDSDTLKLFTKEVDEFENRNDYFNSVSEFLSSVQVRLHWSSTPMKMINFFEDNNLSIPVISHIRTLAETAGFMDAYLDATHEEDHIRRLRKLSLVLVKSINDIENVLNVNPVLLRLQNEVRNSG